MSLDNGWRVVPINQGLQSSCTVFFELAQQDTEEVTQLPRYVTIGNLKKLLQIYFAKVARGRVGHGSV